MTAKGDTTKSRYAANKLEKITHHAKAMGGTSFVEAVQAMGAYDDHDMFGPIMESVEMVEEISEETVVWKYECPTCAELGNMMCIQCAMMQAFHLYHQVKPTVHNVVGERLQTTLARAETHCKRQEFTRAISDYNIELFDHDWEALQNHNHLSMDELVWTMQQWRWLRHGSNVFHEKSIDYLDKQNWIESPAMAHYDMSKFKTVKGQPYPDTRELINGYADDFWVRNPTPDTIKQLWTEGQPPTVLSQYLVNGTYFYLYVKTDYKGTVTMFKSVPNELVQQMEALLDSMPEITRKWNGISQHTFSLNGAEPSLNTPPSSESECGSGSESEGIQCSFYYSDEGPPPLQSESESEEEEDRDNGRLFYLPEYEEIEQVQYTKAAQTTAKRGFKIYKLDPGRQVTDVPWVALSPHPQLPLTLHPLYPPPSTPPPHTHSQTKLD
jgi:hypothetical protein